MIDDATNKKSTSQSILRAISYSINQRNNKKKSS